MPGDFLVYQIWEYKLLKFLFKFTNLFKFI